MSKELSLSHKFQFSDLYIFATQFLIPLLFQTMTSEIKKSKFEKSKVYTIRGIRKFEFVTKTQFLLHIFEFF